MMFAGYVNAQTRTTAHLSCNAKFLLKNIAEKRGRGQTVIDAIKRGELPLVNADDEDNVGSPQTNEGNYYIVSANSGEGEMFGLLFKPADWLVSTGRSWAKINNNGDGGVEYAAGDTRDSDGRVVKAGQTNIYVEGGKIGFIENWKPIELSAR